MRPTAAVQKLCMPHRLKVTSQLLLLLVLGCAGVAVASSCASAVAPASGSADREYSISIDGLERTYIVHVPPGDDLKKPAPLVIAMHGGTGNGAQLARSCGLSARADRNGFIVAYPNGTGRIQGMYTWNAFNGCGYAKRANIDDVKFIDKMIDKLEQDYAIDPKRIYATGMSNGAMMSYRVGCELSNRIAAIAPVAGAMIGDNCHPSSPVSAIVFHGTADQHVLYNGGTSKGLEERFDKPVSHAIEFWVQHDGTSKKAKEEVSASGNIIKDVYSGGKNGTEVVLYTIKGGGHAWPGGMTPARARADVPTAEISATDLMCDFFLKHPKP